jgi:transposase-like protein
MYIIPILSRFITKESIRTVLISFYKKKSYVSIWNWIQHYKPEKKKLHRKRRIYDEFVVDDETLNIVGNKLVWVWVAIELKAKTILGIHTYFF